MTHTLLVGPEDDLPKDLGSSVVAPTVHTNSKCECTRDLGSCGSVGEFVNGNVRDDGKTQSVPTLTDT